MIYLVLCDHLEMTNCITDAIECFHQMNSEWSEESNLHSKQPEWVLCEWSRIPSTCCRLYDYLLSALKRRLSKKQEYLGDAAMNAQQFEEAISEYSSVLSLDPVEPAALFIKRSGAYVALSLWEDALNDANKVRSFVSCRLVLVDMIIIR
jgi:tetratricopeptide (TPR) repeat protein